jgi:2-keto-4-pentenoate hydratase/2-oxohepta-3-ene-1,7-dioic acid hydratase in catechol pathway
MKVAMFHLHGRTRPGVIVGDRIVDFGDDFQTVLDILKLDDWQRREVLGRAESRMVSAPEMVLPLADVVFEAPIQRPGKIMCVGLNYRDHAAEQGKEPPATPMIFAKYATAITHHKAEIVLPPNSVEVDYEAELCVVVGRTGRSIPVGEAYDYIGGYTIINDVSARDMQRQDKQFTRAKSCDTFAPLGPWVVTKDEIPDPHHLSISLTLNGEVMQSSNTNQLIFDIPHLISYLSQSMTLETGDLIATGTPGGVGVFRRPPVFLRGGDDVAVTIEGIGTLRNHVVEWGQ